MDEVRALPIADLRLPISHSPLSRFLDGNKSGSAQIGNWQSAIKNAICHMNPPAVATNPLNTEYFRAI
jgi:hypothetical protein